MDSEIHRLLTSADYRILCATLILAIILLCSPGPASFSRTCAGLAAVSGANAERQVCRLLTSPLCFPKAGPPVVWKKAIGQGFSGPVVADGKLILFHRVGDKETVECLDAATGKEIWRFDYPTRYRDDFGFDEGPRSTPSISAGRVYTFGAEGMLHCLDFATGKKLWAVDTTSSSTFAKVFSGLPVLLLSKAGLCLLNIGGSKPSGLVAFDRDTGKVMWAVSRDEASYSSPVAATVGGSANRVLFHAEWTHRRRPGWRKHPVRIPLAGPHASVCERGNAARGRGTGLHFCQLSDRGGVAAG